MLKWISNHPLLYTLFCIVFAIIFASIVNSSQATDSQFQIRQAIPHSVDCIHKVICYSDMGPTREGALSCLRFEEIKDLCE